MNNLLKAETFIRTDWRGTLLGRRAIPTRHQNLPVILWSYISACSGWNKLGGAAASLSKPDIPVPSAERKGMLVSGYDVHIWQKNNACCSRQCAFWLEGKGDLHLFCRGGFAFSINGAAYAPPLEKGERRDFCWRD